MANSTPENEEAAFQGLLGCVQSIKLFFDFAKELGKELSSIEAYPSYD
jgi:hypothetical protein